MELPIHRFGRLLCYVRNSVDFRSANVDYNAARHRPSTEMVMPSSKLLTRALSSLRSAGEIAQYQLKESYV